MSGDVEPYLLLITSEHRNKPKFEAMLRAVLQPVVDVAQLLSELPVDYDLDVATGAQLDTVGLWVGRTRYIQTPLTGVYFSFDDAALGFDFGTWKGPFDPTSGLVALPDDAYRTLLRATIAANQWDGSIPQAYEAWDIVFAGTGFSILIIDNGNMTMDFALLGGLPDAVTLALLTGGYLALKPSGVRITNYFAPSIPTAPLFGFDVDNAGIGGFDHGAWATTLTPS